MSTLPTEPTAPDPKIIEVLAHALFIRYGDTLVPTEAEILSGVDSMAERPRIWRESSAYRAIWRDEATSLLAHLTDYGLRFSGSERLMTKALAGIMTVPAAKAYELGE